MLTPRRPDWHLFRYRGEPRIPTLEQRAKRSVQGAGARLQEQMRAAFGPLHLLALGEALADNGIHRGLGQT